MRKMMASNRFIIVIIKHLLLKTHACNFLCYDWSLINIINLEYFRNCGGMCADLSYLITIFRNIHRQRYKFHIDFVLNLIRHSKLLWRSVPISWDPWTLVKYHRVGFNTDCFVSLTNRLCMQPKPGCLCFYVVIHFEWIIGHDFHTPNLPHLNYTHTPTLLNACSHVMLF